MKIIFIRHGETTGDVENRYGGDYDDHLTEMGREEAETLCKELKDKGIEMVISSPLVRAQETANILASLGATVITEKRIKERNQYGILTGKTKSEALNDFPELVEKLKDRFNTIEGAESYEDFQVRIEEAFRDIFEYNQYSCVAVIWHGGPMRVLFRDILKRGELQEIGDCAWVELEKNNDIYTIKETKRLELAN